MAFKLLLLCCCFVFTAPPTHSREITDALGREVDIPDTVERVICSGSGCLRLLTYLQAQNMAVAVDDIEGRRRRFDARPYAMANPRFKSLPVFGEFRGKDNPELILALDPAPQVILKLVGTGKGTVGMEPGDLQAKTGIPVVALKYGNLGGMKEDLYGSLRIMAEVVGRQQRADAVQAFFDSQIADLGKRTADFPEENKPSVFLGGVAYAGPHGFQSTEPTYPPFRFVGARNLADDANPKAGEVTTTDIAREKIVEWNPDHLFLDLSTLQLGDAAGGLFELKADPAYQALSAVKTGKVYGVLPYNSYNQNFEAIFADAYFIGTLLYPERFADIDPAAKADEIFTFLVGKPVFAEMNTRFQGLVFRPVPLK